MQDIRAFLESKRNTFPIIEERETCCARCRLGVQASWCDCGCNLKCMPSIEKGLCDSDDEHPFSFTKETEDDSFDIIDEDDYNTNPEFSVMRSTLSIDCVYDEHKINIFKKKHAKTSFIVTNNHTKSKIWMCLDCYNKKWHSKIMEA